MASMEDFTTEELQQKLRNAHSAGDSAAAARFAEVIKARQAGSDVPGFVEKYEQPRPQPAISDYLTGVNEALKTIVSGMTTGAAGYVSGAAEGVSRRFTEDDFSVEDAAMLAQERAAQRTYMPESEMGQRMVKTVGEATEWMPPILGVAPSTMAGFGMSTRAARDLASGARLPQTKAKQGIAQQLQSGDLSKKTIGYQLESKAPDQVPVETGKELVPITDSKSLELATDEQVSNSVPRVIKFDAEIKARRAGVDDRTILRFKGANKQTKQEMRRMLEMHIKGLNNPSFGDRNRASQLAGQSILKPVKYLEMKKDEAGKNLDSVALKLKGEKADFSPAVNEYLDDLGRLGVKFDPETKTLDFSDSQLTGTGGASSRRLLRDVFEEMNKGNGLNAYRGHQFKKFLDIETDIGKATTSKPLAKDVINATKRLRGRIDDILDSNFKEYDAVNTQYKESLEAIDSIDSMLASEIDVGTERAADNIGTLLRRVTGNPTSRDRLINSIDLINSTAKKYGYKSEVDPIALGSFVNTLDNYLGRLQETSFDAGIAKGGNEAARAAMAVSTHGASEVPGFFQRGINKFKKDDIDVYAPIFRELSDAD